MKILIRKLEEIADVIAGQSPPSTTYNDKGEGLPFFQGKTDFGKKHPTTRIWCSEPKKIALPNDILISVRAPVGPVNIANKKSCIGRGLSAIRPKGGNSLDFIFYFLKSNERLIAKNASGSTFSAITQKDLKEIKIPIPERLEDQIRIANILSRAEALIAQRKESIQLLDELLKSTFLDMFGDPVRNEKGWEKVELESLCSDIVDCPHSTPIKADKETEYACIRTSELKNGYISWDSMQYVDISEYEKRTSRLIPNKGDVVYGREGSFGEAIIIPSCPKFCLGQRTMLFRPDLTLCNSVFLWSMVRSDYVYKQALKRNSGSTVGHVNVKDIKKFSVLKPPIEIQTQFAQIVEKVEGIKTKYQESLQELENLYASLSQKAFKGELDLSKMEVKDYNLGHAEPVDPDSYREAAEEEIKYNKQP